MGNAGVCKMTDLMDHMLWAYQGVVKQTAAGGGTVRLVFVANERTVILYGCVGPDDYNAARAVSGRLLDADGDQIGYVLSSNSIDNVVIPMLGDYRNGDTPNTYDELRPSNLLIMGAGDVLRFQATSLIQNEELTLTIRALCDSKPPTVATTGSAGTVTLTENYNKVM